MLLIYCGSRCLEKEHWRNRTKARRRSHRRTSATPRKADSPFLSAGLCLKRRIVSISSPPLDQYQIFKRHSLARLRSPIFRNSIINYQSSGGMMMNDRRLTEMRERRMSSIIRNSLRIFLVVFIFKWFLFTSRSSFKWLIYKKITERKIYK